MRTWLPVRVESLWWMRGLRRLLRSLGTLPLVLDRLQWVDDIEGGQLISRENAPQHNGRRPPSLPPQLGCWIVAPLLPHELQRARCRSLDTSAPQRMRATAQASGAWCWQRFDPALEKRIQAQLRTGKGMLKVGPRVRRRQRHRSAHQAGNERPSAWPRKADGAQMKLKRPPPDVRFTPKSRHWNSAAQCPLRAKSGHSPSFEYLIGGSEQRVCSLRNTCSTSRSCTSSAPPRVIMAAAFAVGRGDVV
jgi:hypothetical protein